MTFRFIAARRTEHSIAIIRRVLEVSRSGYHDWAQRLWVPESRSWLMRRSRTRG